jgi:hypothetical protein
LVINFTFTFDDETLNHSCSCKIDDIVKVKFIQDEKTLEVTGKITSITADIQNLTNAVLSIDASTLYDSNLYTFAASKVLDLNLVTV